VVVWSFVALQSVNVIDVCNSKSIVILLQNCIVGFVQVRSRGIRRRHPLTLQMMME